MPIDQPTDWARPSGSPPDHEAASPTILYVDDSASNVALVGRLVDRRPGIRLLTASLGGIALDLARHCRLDLVLLDLHLPDMAGKDVLARLRAHPATAHVPVVVTSGERAEEHEAGLLALGAQGYLEKPLRIERFYQVIDTYLRPPVTHLEPPTRPTRPG